MQCPAMQKTDEELTRPMAQMKPFHDILLQGCPSLTPLPVKLLFGCIPPPPDSMPGFHRDKSPPTASLRSSFSPCIVNILSVFLSGWELLGEERLQGQLWPGVDTEVALPAYLQPLYYTGCVRDQLPKGHCGGGATLSEGEIWKTCLLVSVPSASVMSFSGPWMADSAQGELLDIIEPAGCPPRRNARLA